MPIAALLFAAISGASAARHLAHEAPRATDLLRAKRAAAEAQRRLDLPAARGGGWVRGGDGFGAPARAAGGGDASAPAVHIHLPRPKTARRSGEPR